MVVGDFAREAKLVVIGAGPAGCGAALRAAELGLEPLVIDPPGAPHAVGGHVLDEAELNALRARLRAASVEILSGRPRFESDRDLAGVEGTLPRIRFRRAIVTGAGGPAARGKLWPASDRIIAPGEWRDASIPERVLVAGDGAAAVVLAGQLAKSGSRVTLAAPGGRLLPDADEELLAPLLSHLRATLAQLMLESTITAVTESGSGVEITFGGHAQTRRYDLVLLAPGDRPDLTSLELARAGVALDERGFIRVDSRLATNNPRIFAAGAAASGGGVGGGSGLWHAAWRQGEVAAECAAGQQSAFDVAVLPCIVRSDPPLAWCGLTEACARKSGTEHVVAEASRGGAAEPTVVARIIAAPGSGLILGAGLAGSGAIEVIGEAVLALEMGAVAGDLAGSLRSDTLLSALLTEAAAKVSE